MERLTIRSKNSDMVWFKDAENGNAHLEPCEMTAHHNRMVLDKLATYEDADREVTAYFQARYLFKAKRKDNGEWVQGYLVYDNRDKLYRIIMKIQYSTGTCISTDNAPRVDASTICQCTGLKDKNGKLIWENDIVMTVYDGNEHIYQVVWDESELDFKATNGKENYKSNFEYLPCCDEIEILGNIFNNQELLEE